MVLGTSTAFTFSVLSMSYSILTRGRIPSQVFFETSASLICFVSWGRYLENLAKSRTTNALAKLISLAPSHAIVLTYVNGAESEREIPYALIQKGDLLKVIPGEKIPTDGEIEFGMTTVDESLVTGEPFPVTKAEGETVIGGTLNLTVILLLDFVNI